MGIALFTVTSLFAPLQGMLNWFMPVAPQATPVHARPAWRPSALHRHIDVPRKAVKACAHRPVRVVRVMEPNAGPASAGRMVISGRMADVCAELDRLAALEAMRH